MKCFFGECCSLIFCLIISSASRAQKLELVLPVGHTDRVLLARYSPDGKIIATASYDNSIKIWNARNGRLLHNISGHQNWARDINFSPDGKTIVTAWDSAAQVYEVHSGKLLYTLKGHTAKVIIARYSPDGKSIITADEYYSVRIWEGQSEKLMRNTPWVTSAHYSYDGQKFATTAANNDSIVRIWDSKTGVVIHKLKGHREWSQINNACFSPDGKYIVSASSDHTAIIWDIQSGELLHRLVGHTEEVLKVCYSPDGNNIATVSADKSAKVWDAKSGWLLFSLEGHTNKVANVVYSAEGKNILTWAYDYTAKIWDAQNGKLIYSFEGVSNASYSPDDKYIMAAASNNIKVWDSRNARLVMSLQGHSVMATSASYSADGKKMVTSSEDGTGKIWDTQTGRLVQVLKGHTAVVNSAGFSKDGKNVITTSYDSTAKIWDVQSGALLHTLAAHTDKLNMALYSPDGKIIVTTSNDNKPKIWDAQTGKLLCSVEGNYGRVSNACFSNDGKTIVIPDVNISAKLWEVQTGKLLRIFKDDEEEYNLSDVRFSPDDKKVVAVYSSGAINIWDAEKNVLVQHIKAHKEPIVSIALSEDGKWMVSTAEGEPAKIWEFATGKLIHTLTETTNGIGTVIFSAGNKEIVTADNDRMLRVWDLQKGKLIKTIAYTGELYGINWKHKKIITHENSQVFVADFETGEEIFSSVAIDENEFIAKTKDNYYQASPAAARWLSWKKNNNLYDFDQWDIQYNRPDKLLAALGNMDTALITAYWKAYEKRVKKMNVDTTIFRKEYHIPETEILNAKEIEGVTQLPNTNVKVRCKDTNPSNKLSKIFVYVNGNPMYGVTGLDVKNRNTNDITLDIPVVLNSGKNNIKVSCVNNRSAESLRQTVYVNYENEKPSAAVWYIGIGVAKYKDESYNLTYSSKDAYDMDNIIRNYYPAAKTILLLDTQATRNNILRIKQRLLKESKADDKIIVSFSGHGVIDKNYDFYFATHDIDFNKPAAYGLSYDDIEWLLDSIPARNKLVLMDACHSGELDKEDQYDVAGINKHPADSNVRAISKGAKLSKKDSTGLGMKNSFELMQELFANLRGGNGATVISAAAGTELAFEGNNWKNGVFTYCVLTGLAEKKADSNNDGEITMSELHKYVSAQVEKLTNGRQKPTSRQQNFDNDWRVW